MFDIDAGREMSALASHPTIPLPVTGREDKYIGILDVFTSGFVRDGWLLALALGF